MQVASCGQPAGCSHSSHGMFCAQIAVEKSKKPSASSVFCRNVVKWGGGKSPDAEVRLFGHFLTNRFWLVKNDGENGRAAGSGHTNCEPSRFRGDKSRFETKRPKATDALNRKCTKKRKTLGKGWGLTRLGSRVCRSGWFVLPKIGATFWCRKAYG